MPFVPPILVWFCAASPTDLNVVLGTNDLHSPSLEVKGVTSIVPHKDFKILNMDSDIALLLLDSPITFSGLKEPLCVPRQPSPSRWHECWVAGWGLTDTGTRPLRISGKLPGRRHVKGFSEVGQ